ncbi:MAG: S1 RNA-binding domain-containing protein, partial [Chloroflexota bacterium]|nr:S1 RNA-binding domain-containing protein [Chloroflexota bacterium]
YEENQAVDNITIPKKTQAINTRTQLKSGELRAGKITRIKEEAIFVDVGGSYEAVVPRKDFIKLGENILDSFSPGDTITVRISHVPNSGNPFASISKPCKNNDWERVEKYLRSGETIELEIIKYNRGGLIAAFGNIEGFIPNSQISDLRQGTRSERVIEFKKQKIGTSLPLRVIEADEDRARLILSTKAEKHEHDANILQDLEVGQTVSGEVVNLVKFGAFVDFGGGVNGLIHISELAWQHVHHPSELLDVGDEVTVKIQDVDLERKRISLSRKSLCYNPWSDIEDRYQVHDLVEGVVTTVREFGAFISLAAGIEGLLHISEMPLEPGMTPPDAVKPGEKILLRITSISPQQQRIGLSLQQVRPEERLSWMMYKKHALPLDVNKQQSLFDIDNEVNL